MNGINTNFGRIITYSEKIGTNSYTNDGIFSSLLADSQETAQKPSENKKTEYDFSDMYVRTHQTSAKEAVEDFYGTGVPWKNRDYLHVPVAKDLDELLESIEKGIAEGKSLRNILQDRIDRYAKEYGEAGVLAVGNVDADLILVHPETGRVIDSSPKGRVILLSQEMQDIDYAMVRSQADDLATFIRYTVFKKETDDSEKVSALLSELKEKQSAYDTSRFMPIFYSGGKQGLKNLKYWQSLLGEDLSGLGGSKGMDESDAAADELLKILEKRDSSKVDTDDGLIELIDQMKAENIAKSNVTKTVLHNALFRMY